MKYYFVNTGALDINTYIIPTKENNAIIIDCGGSEDRVEAILTANNLTAKWLLLTHGHFDHAGGCSYFQDKGVKIYIHKLDSDKLSSNKNLAYQFGLPFKNFTADYMFEGDEVLQFDDISVKVLHTPGHTIGSCSFVIGDTIFSGDTLFKQSIGRTDFEDGDYSAIISSLKKLVNLSGDYTVCPGHDEITSLDFERKNNLYVQF